MTKAIREKATEYRLPGVSTPEELECKGFKTIRYGNEIICIGYYYTYNAPCYYTATYQFSGKGKNCDDECRLKWVSTERYEDEGHALKAEMQYKEY